MVVDIGGDIGRRYVHPRLPARGRRVRRHRRRTDELPHAGVVSIGLGGGSLVREELACATDLDSVGYELTSKALVFGGDVLTTTDIVVAAGLERYRRAVAGEASA